MFEGLDLHPSLVRGTQHLGYKKPTSIQKLVIPAALQGRDILASAPTGTGKTAAFLLPALQHLLDFPRRDPGQARVLILAPTRELAAQVYEQAKQLAQFTDLNLGLVTGGVNYGSQSEYFTRNLDLLVATPGRLVDYLESEDFDASDVELLILDEADRMLDMGFLSAMTRILEDCRHRRLGYLFSATLEGKHLTRFAEVFLNDPIALEAEPSRKERGKIHQWIYLADSQEHKQALLQKLLDDAKTAIVFVKTRERVEQIQAFLQSKDISAVALRGEMPQHLRNKAIDSFRQGKVSVLIATDVAARGIDVAGVSHVINFDMPRTADLYVHRVGRTGRAGAKGTAISLVEAHDMAILGKIERYTDQKLARRKIAGLEAKNREARVPAKKKKKKAKKKN